MTRRRRGFGLVAAMTVSALVCAFGYVVLSCASAARERVAQRKFQLQAHAMALSGLEYAQAMLAHRRWHQDTRFLSPDLDGGRFSLTVSHSGAGWVVRSLGTAGPRSESLEKRLP